MASSRPLDGIVVLDLSRMLPGAVLARMLLDLGARVIKVEAPGGGDLMRHAPPLVEGVGAGFRALMAGCESIALDLREESGARTLRRLVKHADVVVESFRPGTMEKWGLGRERLQALNPGLVTCSLSGFGGSGPHSQRVAHDLNLVAASGLLSLLPPGGLPKVQLADVTTGLLAASAVLAALLARFRTGKGLHVEQPLAMGPVPFLSWVWADAAAGGEGLPMHLLAGEAPCYRVYACADGVPVALGAVEPKFWAELVEAMGLGELAGAGLDCGEAGRSAAERVAARFAEEASGHWVAIAEARNLPLTLVRPASEARRDPYYAEHAGYLPNWPTPPGARMPRAGEDTDRVLAEFGLMSERVRV